MSCSEGKKADVVATIAGENIYLSEVDYSVQNTLYEFLYSIFRARVIGLENLIEQKLIQKEATVLGITPDSLLALNLIAGAKKIPLSQYIQTNGLAQGVVDPAHPFQLIAISTKEGHDILLKSYHDHLKNKYLDSLKSKYAVKIKLNPPVAPKLDLSSIPSHARGSLKSRHTITIVSDFTCSSCQEHKTAIDDIYEHFKEKFRFEYVHLAVPLNKSILFAECASKQDKYWEASDLLYSRNVNDSISIAKLSQRLGLNVTKCLECMKSFDTTTLTRGMSTLAEMKITATPTLLVDGRMYFGELSTKALDAYILEATADH